MIDKDGTGFITFDELMHAIRHKCKKTEKVMPTSSIKALWCALDKDCSNALERNEMGSFLRAGADSLPKPPPVGVKQRTKSKPLAPLGSSANSPRAAAPHC